MKLIILLIIWAKRTDMRFKGLMLILESKKITMYYIPAHVRFDIVSAECGY